MLADLRSRLLAVDDAVARHADARAVVAVLLRDREGVEVLVMERARRDSDPWSGHWSFPGGRRQAGEPLLDAVLRETVEEVGLSLRTSELLGCLPARAPGNRQEMLVLPFVFAWDREDAPRLGPEAVSVAWVSVADLPRTRTTVPIRIQDRERALPAYVQGTRTIWGFTYRLLEDLLPVLSGPPSRP